MDGVFHQRDACPIQREIFAQRVIEDLPGSPARGWTDAGVTVTATIAAYDALGRDGLAALK